MQKTQPERGILLSIVLVITLIWHTLGAALIGLTVFAYSGGADIALMVLLLSAIAGLYAMWNFKKWGLYLYLCTGIVLILFFESILFIIPMALLAYLGKTKWKLFS